MILGGMRGMRYREGLCPKLGRIRPVHLGEWSSMERRMDASADGVACTTRMVWQGSLPVPKAGEYLSVHGRHGKELMIVMGNSASCVCCWNAAKFVVLSGVAGVMPQAAVCKCAAEKKWMDAVTWGKAPGEGLCRKAGSGSLAAISRAIKQKNNDV